MSEQYRIGDKVRLQLSPKGTWCRYDWDADKERWFDYGSTGGTAEGKITGVDKDIHVATLHILDNQTSVHAFNIPLEGNRAYYKGLYDLPGWPVVIHREASLCDCGCDFVQDGGLHSSWCSKLKEKKLG